MKYSFVSEKAEIDPTVKIGNFVTIHDEVKIGSNSTIEDYCVIGYPASGEFENKKLVIGKDSWIRTHSVLYQGSSFGDALKVGHHSMIREGVKAGKNLQIGSFNDIEGDCKIGNFVRFHSNVHIGRGADIGDLVWIFPYAVLTNDPIPPSGLKEGVTVGDGAVICTSAVVLPGCKIGKGAFVAAMSRAKGEVPAASLVVGFEGTIIGGVDKLKHKATGKRHPWMSHFSSYYPHEMQEQISRLHVEITSELSKFQKS